MRTLPSRTSTASERLRTGKITGPSAMAASRAFARGTMAA